MAAASLTDRRAFASIGVVLLALASPAVASALVEGAELSPNWRLIDVFSMPFELVFRIFGEPGNFPELSTFSVVAVNLAWTLGGHRGRRLALLPTGGGPMSDDTPVRDRNLRAARRHTAPAAEHPRPACSRRHPARVRPVAAAAAGSAPGRSVRRAAALVGMIAVNNVSKFYGSVVAVSEVSFAIDQGVTALLGPNGAGKSTLFRMLCGLTPASRGTLRVLGEDPRRQP